VLLFKNHFRHKEKENEEKFVENLPVNKEPIFGIKKKKDFFPSIPEVPCLS